MLTHEQRRALIPTPRTPHTLPWKSGSYESSTGSLGNSPQGQEAFGQWRGRPVSLSMTFNSGYTWAQQLTYGAYSTYATTKYGDGSICFTMGLFPMDDTSTLADAASGTYDSNYAALAQAIVSSGHPHSYIRLGWEFNTNGYQWAATRPDSGTGGNGGSADPVYTDAANYRTAFQRMVTQFRAAGWQGKVVFCPANGKGSGPSSFTLTTPDRCYPGDEYVDVIAVDIYDFSNTQPTAFGRWQEARTLNGYGMDFWSSFCVAGTSRLDSSSGAGTITTDTTAKTFAICEWGLRNTDYGASTAVYNGGDSPYFVQQMWDYLANVVPSLGVQVEFESYFNKDNSATSLHRIDTLNFPQASRKYQELFGNG